MWEESVCYNNAPDLRPGRKKKKAGGLPYYLEAAGGGERGGKAGEEEKRNLSPKGHAAECSQKPASLK